MKAPLKRSRSTADGGDEDSQDQLQELLESGAVDEEQKTDNTTLLRLLEEGEKVYPLCKHKPVLRYCLIAYLFCTFSFIEDFLLVKLQWTALVHIITPFLPHVHLDSAHVPVCSGSRAGHQ